MSTQAFTFLQQASNDGSFDYERADEKRVFRVVSGWL